MDYTVRAQRWHIIGTAPMAAFMAALVFVLGQAGGPASIWRLNRWASGLLLFWWFLGIAFIRRHPKAWTAGIPQAARHATRILWSAAVAQLVSTLTMLGMHGLYTLILGRQYIWLDALVVCGELFLAQAAGVKTLDTHSRPRPFLYGGTAMICASLLLAFLA